MEFGSEGCLSLPGLIGAVPRYRRLRYRGLTLDGEILEREAEGFHARVVQHECDHLDGILYPQRMTDLSTLMFTSEIEAAGAHVGLWQYFAVLLPIQSVGVMGDARTYENACALRIVESLDGMTADWTYLDHDLLRRISSRIINEVRGLNRVVLDISSKPPSTIEWE
jgi:hypothetical protein